MLVRGGGECSMRPWWRQGRECKVSCTAGHSPACLLHPAKWRLLHYCVETCAPPPQYTYHTALVHGHYHSLVRDIHQSVCPSIRHIWSVSQFVFRSVVRPQLPSYEGPVLLLQCHTALSDFCNVCQTLQHRHIKKDTYVTFCQSYMCSNQKIIIFIKDTLRLFFHWF